MQGIVGVGMASVAMEAATNELATLTQKEESGGQLTAQERQRKNELAVRIQRAGQDQQLWTTVQGTQTKERGLANELARQA